jgi:D-inositol-3-phosphate glycosyltransferase
MARIAVLSYHTSPLAQPGTGDGGGMNVYVRELSAALARTGHDVDIFTRRDEDRQSDVVVIEPGVRVRHVAAGPSRVLERDELPLFVDEFTGAVADIFRNDGIPDVLHANYWLSGLAGHRLKHDFNIPLVATFHTLEKIKADSYETESPTRAELEQSIIGCADAVLASCDVEAHQITQFYDVADDRVHVVPLGVEHAFFSPGYRPQARRALGLDGEKTLMLFVGRLQRLKGVDLALETLIELRNRGHRAHLAIIGGPSGRDGKATLIHLHRRVQEAGVIEHVTFVAPQSHQLLSTWMRAADVTLVPSRSESFGLVALESSAAGTPVIASAVGGLTTLVEEGVNGRLVTSRQATQWADRVEEILEPEFAMAMSNAAVLMARRYTWRRAAEQLLDVVEDLRSRTLVTC